jgi:hypothetical protein
MFGKRGGKGLPGNKPVHEVMARALWPAKSGFGAVYRDHMINMHQKRLTEKPPRPLLGPKPNRFR